MAAQSQKFVGDEQTGLRSRVLGVRFWRHSDYWDVQSDDKTVQGQKPLVYKYTNITAYYLQILGNIF